jgi:hypothetical protein
MWVSASRGGQRPDRCIGVGHPAAPLRGGQRPGAGNGAGANRGGGTKARAQTPASATAGAEFKPGGTRPQSDALARPAGEQPLLNKPAGEEPVCLCRAHRRVSASCRPVSCGPWAIARGRDYQILHDLGPGVHFLLRQPVLLFKPAWPVQLSINLLQQRRRRFPRNARHNYDLPACPLDGAPFFLVEGFQGVISAFDVDIRSCGGQEPSRR